MNAANLCPSPRAVSDRSLELTPDIDIDCSARNREKFVGLLEESRSRIAEQLGVSPDEIALVPNTSEANNIINNGLALKAGMKSCSGTRIIQPATLRGMCVLRGLELW
jgi:hypothetical protein